MSNVMVPPSVTRNGVSLTPPSDVFGKKSPNKGKTFFKIPSVAEAKTDDERKNILTWLGEDAWSLLDAATRRLSMDIWMDKDNYNAEGQFILENWIESFTDFSAESVKLSDIEEMLEEKQEQQQTLFDAVNDENMAEIMPQIKSIGTEIKGLKAQREEIKARYQLRADKRKAKKEAKAAAEAAAVSQPVMG